jgi:hypothetical protein
MPSIEHATTAAGYRSGGIVVGDKEIDGVRKLWGRWLILARKIGNFQSRILLTLFYFVIVLPFGLGVRLLADPLHIRARAPTDTAWQPRETRDVDLGAGRRQS